MRTHRGVGMKRYRVFVFSVVLFGWMAASVFAIYPRQISFSGYMWNVKKSNGRVGPGPNYFYYSTQNVWVDLSGKLHMKLRKNKGKWYCSEIVSNQNFGYGTYRFYIDSYVDNLDPNVVLGLFTWSDNPDYNHREIDQEFARWADPNNLNAQ